MTSSTPRFASAVLTGALALALPAPVCAEETRVGAGDWETGAATLTTNVTNEAPSITAKRQEGSVDYYMTYGLPGKPGYRYTRPFDFFLFEFTA